MEDFVTRLATEHPPWAAYRALMACRLVALDKQPGTRPLDIGEIYRQLMAKCAIFNVDIRLLQPVAMRNSVLT